jgi:hypothetical protein
MVDAVRGSPGRVESCRLFQNVRDRACWLTGSSHQRFSAKRITIPAMTHPVIEVDVKL